MDTTLKYFWGASYGNVYPTLSDLVNSGLAIKKEDGENKRNKLIYTITDKGLDYLKEWLKSPVEKDDLRYETLLKLFIGNEQGAELTIWLLCGILPVQIITPMLIILNTTYNIANICK